MNSENNDIEATYQRIAQWNSRKANAATIEQMHELKQTMEDLYAEYEAAQHLYRQEAVKKATVFGWQVIANDLGISAKQLHKWHREVSPELDDLSNVPVVDIPRVERIKARSERKALQLEDLARRQREFAQMVANNATLHKDSPTEPQNMTEPQPETSNQWN